MSDTFTVELGGRSLVCRVPLFRVCTHAFMAYSRANGYRGADAERVQADSAELSTIIAAMGAMCLPADAGAPRLPRNTVTFDQWLAYGNDVERWVWRKRRTWLEDSAWTKAATAALDAVLDEAIGTEEAAEDAAAPFEDPAPDSSAA